MTALARWCYRHRLVVLLLWVGALLGVGFSASSAGTNYANVFSLPDTDSKTAYDLMMKAFGGHGAYVEDPKDLRGALDEAMNFKGPALVNVKLSLGSQRKAQEFRWHS